jgi:hypothetical protein
MEAMKEKRTGKKALVEYWPNTIYRMVGASMYSEREGLPEGLVVVRIPTAFTGWHYIR